MALKRMTIMADFETTVDPDDVRAWAVCAVDIDTGDIVHLGQSLEGFMEWLSKGKNTKCFFHNLRFDGEFLLAYLLKNGYTYNRGVDSRGERVALQPNEFTTLITDDGLFYSIEVLFKRNKKKLEKVTFYDSLKKLPFKVAQIAKAFELEQSKGIIDYEAPRPLGYQMTEQEKEYIINDCKIVAQALKIQLGQGLDRMTNASDALNWYKNSIGKANFEKWFPVLPLAMDADIRRAYRGGYVYLNPKYKGSRGLVGKTYDVNSLYPSRMAECLLPYGYPLFFEGEPEKDEKYPLFFVHLKTRFYLKKNHLPTLQLKNTGRFVQTEYLTSSKVKIGKRWEDDPVEMWLTSVDYQLFIDHYDLEETTYINGLRFKGAVGMFKEYIDYWKHIKETSEGPMRQLAKLMLNSLYGKFASATHGRVKMPYLDEDGVVQYRYSDEEIRDPIYTPMACFITAYARDKTIRSAQAVYDRFIYADTDSLHLVGTETPPIEVHKSKLGAWKDEGTFVDSKFIRAKTYMETVLVTKENSLKEYAKALSSPFVTELMAKGDKVQYLKRKVTCAGMPDNLKEMVTYDNFAPGESFPGKLMPRRFPGGVILEPTTFTIMQ